MRDTHAIPRHADGGTSGDDAAGWRIACLIALAAFLGMGLAAFLVGILPGDLSVRYGLLLEEHTRAAHAGAMVQPRGHLARPPAGMLS